MEIKLPESDTDKSVTLVPPNSPNEQFNFELECIILPDISANLKDIELPFVRDIGVKATIDYLATYFNCIQYKTSLPQFWFLDIFAECIWRLQDEYFFPLEYQIIILRWVLYVLNLVRDKPLLTRKEVFRIFSEAVTVADELIQTGQALGSPADIFSLIIQDDVDDVSISSERDSTITSTESSISLSSDSSDNQSYVAMEFEDKTEIFKLPKPVCITSAECVSSDIETPTESSNTSSSVIEEEAVSDKDTDQSDEEAAKDNVEIESLDIDMNDFVLVNVDSLEPISQASQEHTSTAQSFQEHVSRMNFRMKGAKPDCSQFIRPIRSDYDLYMEEKKEEDEIMKAWFEYHMWQNYLEEMEDPLRGYLQDLDKPTVVPVEVQPEQKENFDYWLKYMKDFDKLIQNTNEKIFINLCALMAIKQLVFDYLYESFQFMMVQFLFNSKHYLTTQKINDFWCVPKRLKSEIKRPARRKPKKPKKEKKKKDKKSDKSKKSKKSSKKSKKSKKDKKSKKSSKSSKKSKDKKKLTKEEKAELARIQREKELLEELMRRNAENKVFMFPLGDATNDDFFKNIFTNWTKPEPKDKKKDKKGKKGKKGKK